MSQPVYDPDAKLGELLLIIADALKDEPAGGAVKVNKLAFFAEFAHVRATGQPITGAEYQRQHAGPVPRGLKRVRNALLASGDAELREEKYRGRIQHRLVAKRPPRWTVFSPSERAAIEETLVEYRSATGTRLMDISHEEPAWELFEDGETIPFVMAFASTRPPSERARRRARELAEEYGVG